MLNRVCLFIPKAELHINLPRAVNTCVGQSLGLLALIKARVNNAITGSICYPNFYRVPDLNLRMSSAKTSGFWMFSLFTISQSVVKIFGCKVTPQLYIN